MEEVLPTEKGHTLDGLGYDANPTKESINVDSKTVEEESAVLANSFEVLDQLEGEDKSHLNERDGTLPLEMEPLDIRPIDELQEFSLDYEEEGTVEKWEEVDMSRIDRFSISPDAMVKLLEDALEEEKENTPSSLEDALEEEQENTPSSPRDRISFEREEVVRTPLSNHGQNGSPKDWNLEPQTRSQKRASLDVGVERKVGRVPNRELRRRVAEIDIANGSQTTLFHSRKIKAKR